MALPRNQFEITVTCESSLKKYRSKTTSARLIFFPTIERIRMISEILYDMIALIWCSVADLDVVYLLGYAACLFAVIPRVMRKKIFINVDGLEWKRRKFPRIIRRALKLMELVSVRVANVIVADSMVIQRYFKETYGASPWYIPYAAPIVYHSSSEEIIGEYGLAKEGYYLVVARLEPENNIDLIVEGFKKAKTDRKLVVVGPLTGNNYVRSLLALKESNVIFLGGIYDAEMLRALRLNCFAHLHGHEVGGTNPSLLEAMGCGNAIIALDVPFNREVVDGSAFFFRKDPADLAGKIMEVETDPSELISMRERARKIAVSRYSLGQVSTEYTSLFLKYTA